MKIVVKNGINYTVWSKLGQQLFRGREIGRDKDLKTTYQYVHNVFNFLSLFLSKKYCWTKFYFNLV